MHEEYIDIYNENMEPIGSSMKKDAHRLGLWHKSIHCWLFSKIAQKTYVIFQKRASTKLLMPNYFDVSVAGHYEKGENMYDGFREVNEELGLNIENNAWHYLGIKFDVGTSLNAINKEFCEVFFAETHNDLSHYKMNAREVDAIVWIEIKDGLRLFSGETDEITVQGIKWDNQKAHSIKSNFNIKRDNFIPRTDFYYAKIFAIADLYFKGYEYLYI